MRTLTDNIEGRANRWAMLAEFAAKFLRPFTPADGVPREQIAKWERDLGLRLPQALVEFYELCGNAKDVWSKRDVLACGADLRLVNDVLVIWDENQGCFQIGIQCCDLHLEDPPVVWDAGSWLYKNGEEGEFSILSQCVSSFALNMAAYVANFRPDPLFGYTTNVQCVLAILHGCYAECQLQPRFIGSGWRDWYFQDDDAFINVSETGHIYPIFTTRSAARRFFSLMKGVPVEWSDSCRLNSTGG